MKQFIGPKQILGIIKSERKLFNNDEIIEVKFSDGGNEVFTKRMFEAVVKDSETDLTALRNNRLYPVVKEVLEVLLKWGVKVNEVDFLFALTTQSLNESIKKADEKVWKKIRSEITMFDLDEILRENKQENKSGE